MVRPTLKARLIHYPLAAALICAAAFDAGATMVIGDANTITDMTPTITTLIVTNSATLTVTIPGEIELLLVGGGGGAGGGSGTAGYNSGDSRGGGGGGGGVIHKMNFRVKAGTYPISVGAGGAVNRSNDTIASARGGDTTGFGLTALGGGPGGCVDPTAYYNSSSLVGASGGGGSKHSNGRSYPGGTALASDENENMGHAGANASDYKNGGGGGGAVSAGSGYTGGDGYCCDISGEMLYYGGGGGGGRRYYAAEPGLGGGKECYGGGGSGQSSANTYPESGGPGIAIVRFIPNATPDFAIKGYDKKGILDDDFVYLVITNSTTLHVTGSSQIELLMVGGGGGAGGLSSSASGYNSGDSRGGGGGGGSVINTNIIINAGDYPITIGAGGTFCTSANYNTTAIGGSTSGFGLTALGGGPGGWVDPQYNYSINDLGASGGGGSKHSSSGKAIAGGTALASDANGNLGHKGANASDYKNGGGGGGAGGPGGPGGSGHEFVGGAGYPYDITGETVYYAGGGGGGRRYAAAEPGFGGGKSCYGGGGSGQSASNAAPESGGPGILIIRYRKPKNAFFLVVR